jgi:hypothetical protein
MYMSECNIHTYIHTCMHACKVCVLTFDLFSVRACFQEAPAVQAAEMVQEEEELLM